VKKAGKKVATVFWVGMDVNIQGEIFFFHFRNCLKLERAVF